MKVESLNHDGVAALARCACLRFVFASSSPSPASFTIDFIPTPVDGSIIDARWSGWDTATGAIGARYWLVSFDEARAAGSDSLYLQMSGGGSTALSLLETIGVLGAIPAAQAVALGVLRDNGWTITSPCSTP